VEARKANPVAEMGNWRIGCPSDSQAVPLQTCQIQLKTREMRRRNGTRMVATMTIMTMRMEVATAGARGKAKAERERLLKQTKEKGKEKVVEEEACGGKLRRACS
jgi:hypothetical protein